MQYFPPALENLVEQFAKLPGVGVKSAQRLAFYVLSMPDDEANAFAQAVISAKATIHCCPVCQNLTDGTAPAPSVPAPSGTSPPSVWWLTPRTWPPWSAPVSTRACTMCSTG